MGVKAAMVSRHTEREEKKLRLICVMAVVFLCFKGAKCEKR